MLIYATQYSGMKHFVTMEIYSGFVEVLGKGNTVLLREKLLVPALDKISYDSQDQASEGSVQLCSHEMETLSFWPYEM